MVVQTNSIPHPPNDARIHNAMKRLFMKKFRTPERYKTKQPNLVAKPTLKTNYVDKRYLGMCKPGLTHIAARSSKPQMTRRTGTHFIIYQHKDKYVDLNMAFFNTKRKTKSHCECITRWLSNKSPAMQIRIIDALVQYRAKLDEKWGKKHQKPTTSHQFATTHWNQSRARNQLVIRKFLEYDKTFQANVSLVNIQTSDDEDTSMSSGNSSYVPEFDHYEDEDYMDEVYATHQAEQIADRSGYPGVLDYDEAHVDDVTVMIRYSDFPGMLMATFNSVNNLEAMALAGFTLIAVSTSWLAEQPLATIIQIGCIICLIYARVCVNSLLHYLRERMN